MKVGVRAGEGRERDCAARSVGGESVIKARPAERERTHARSFTLTWTGLLLCIVDRRAEV